MTVPVYLLGRTQRPILGLPLVRYAEVAAARAKLAVIDRLPTSGDVIVIDGEAAITASALTALVAARPDDPAAALADAGSLVARVDAAHVRGAASVAQVLAEQKVERLELAVARFPAEASRAQRRRAEDVLLRGACKTLLSGDYLGALNRELTIPMVRQVARTGMRPNTVTVISFFFTIAAAVPLVSGGYKGLVLGALLQWFGSLLDGVDGKLARLKGQISVTGAKLDSWLDMVYYAVLFGALGIGLSRDHAPALVAALAGVTLTGMFASFVVIAGMRRKLVPRDRPELFGPLVYRLIDQYKADPGIGFARATIRVTTRAGMPHIFLVVALVGALPVGYAVAAVAANLVWILGLRLERLALEGMQGAGDAA
jgi:phosphatidylglycerophosphate synthase